MRAPASYPAAWPRRPPRRRSGIEERAARSSMLAATAWFALGAPAGSSSGRCSRGTTRRRRAWGSSRRTCSAGASSGRSGSTRRAAPGPELVLLPSPLGHLLDDGRAAEALRPARLRLPPRRPLLLSAATPPLLYAIGRAIWRPTAGAAAAASRSSCCRSRSPSRASTRSRCRSIAWSLARASGASCG